MERLTQAATQWTGSFHAFILAVIFIVLWAATGPYFHFSDTWQLVVNTSTTIVTFLMVFLIQRSQNKDTMALQLKLDELVAAVKGASNRLIDVEDLSEEEVRRLHGLYAELAQRAKAEPQPCCRHSVEDIAQMSDKDQALATAFGVVPKKGG